MDGLGRPAPFPSVGAGAGPIVPPPHGIVFGRAAAGAAAHPVQNGGSNRNVSPSRNRKVPPVAAKQQQLVPKQQQTAPPNASVKNSELLRLVHTFGYWNFPSPLGSVRQSSCEELGTE